jgi:hypothetical protein
VKDFSHFSPVKKGRVGGKLERPKRRSFPDEKISGGSQNMTYTDSDISSEKEWEEGNRWPVSRSFFTIGDRVSVIGPLDQHRVMAMAILSGESFIVSSSVGIEKTALGD